MKQANKEMYILESILFVFVIIFNIIFKHSYAYNLGIVIFAIIFYKKYGFMRDKSYIKPSVMRIIISVLLITLLITNLIGLGTGFYKNVLKITRLSTIFQGIILTGITIFCEEVIRYIIAKNSQINKKPIYIFTIGIIILNIIMQINPEYFYDRWRIFVFITAVIIPIVAEHILCSYLSYKVGFLPALVYRLTISIYFVVSPIIPNIGDYLYSVVKVLMPFTIYYFTNRILEKADKAKKYSKKMSRRIVYMPIIACLLAIIVLVSGIFSYKMIAIGSGSMEPVYYMGDAVIYKKVKNTKELKKGTVIAFEHSNTVITHRIHNVIKENGQTIYITKGDNNKKPDDFKTEEKDILGTVKYVVKYAGYPTLWINQLTK